MKRLFYILFVLFISCYANAQNDSTNHSEVELITVFEKMPEFVGGHEALTRYVNSNAIYTKQALKENVNGIVYVSFWIETDGSTVEPRILRGLHPDLDSISIDLVKSMPKWIPATQRGKPIGCQFNFPIKFDFDPNQNFDKPEPS